MAGTLVANTINTDTGLFSTNNAYLGIAKAWVNFVGQTGVVNNAFNVSSITRNGTGDYTANFTTAMPNANYVVAGSAVGSSNSSYLGNIASQGTATSTTACRFVFQYAASTYDQNPIGVVFFGS